MKSFFSLEPTLEASFYPIMYKFGELKNLLEGLEPLEGILLLELVKILF